MKLALEEEASPTNRSLSGSTEQTPCADGKGTLDEMERAADERSPAVFWFVDDPSLDPVRRHPRFSAVLARIGLPERY